MIPIHLTHNGPMNSAIISFKPHNICNFTCDYCHPNSNDGSERWNLNYKAVASFINAVREKNKYVYLEILGGEPTLWPELQSFIDEISHENLIIELNTNGSRTLRYWEEFNPGQNVIIFSWHSKEVNSSHLLKVANIMKNKAHVCIAFLMTPENWNKALIDIKEFEKINVNVFLVPTRKSLVSHELYPFTPEQIHYISTYKSNISKNKDPDWLRLYPSNIKFNGLLKNWKDITYNKEHIFTNWTCNAGLDRFVIEPSGEIFRCWPAVGGRIGNVYTNYQLPSTPIICTYSHPCHCKLDAIVEKWSPNYV